MSKKITEAEKKRLDAPPIAQREVPQFLYVVIFASIGLVCIVAILALRPQSDIVVVIGVVGGLMTSIILSFMSYIKASEASAQSKETYHVVNSRMTLAIGDAVKAAIGEGRRQGRRESERRTDKLAQEAKK
jgi:hypothetical protein